MRKPDPKHARMAEQPLLSGLSRHELARLAPLFDELELPAGSVLTRQGFTAGETFLVRSGVVSVEIDGTEVAQCGPGELIGELAVLARTPRTATVTAVTDLSLFVVTPRALVSVLSTNETLAERVASIVARRAS